MNHRVIVEAAHRLKHGWDKKTLPLLLQSSSHACTTNLCTHSLEKLSMSMVLTMLFAFL